MREGTGFAGKTLVFSTFERDDLISGDSLVLSKVQIALMMRKLPPCAGLMLAKKHLPNCCYLSEGILLKKLCALHSSVVIDNALRQLVPRQNRKSAIVGNEFHSIY